ncbi:MAG: class I SAM-dependent methyltransferase [Acidobacteriaceae bacterium]|nr:class I SAM-dependent methyltransferase [Acidobacteriaceae bacterium]
MGITIEEYRQTEAEQARTADLLRLLPKNRQSVLDIGARDGHFSKLLTQYFGRVVALDLEKPPFAFDGVETVAGDVTALKFRDNEFDCVFCAEVLEHVPNLETACREIARVAAHEVLIGVPYRQDTRIGRTTCRQCGNVNPPWGHVNTFDERKLKALFAGLRVAEVSFIGTNREASNALATFLMDLAGNPWGTYDQEEGCIYCGAPLLAPAGRRSLISRVLSTTASSLVQIQTALTKPHGNWIHVLFQKDRPVSG